MESEQLDIWTQTRPGERIIDIGQSLASFCHIFSYFNIFFIILGYCSSDFYLFLYLFHLFFYLLLLLLSFILILFIKSLFSALNFFLQYFIFLFLLFCYFVIFLLL